MTYREKSNESFHTRLRLFIFNQVINNLDSFTEESFLEFKITDQLIKLYTAEYYQFKKNETMDVMGRSLTINQIYSKMEELRSEKESIWQKWKENYFDDVFKVKFRESVFNKLKKADKCEYCGITLKEINELASKKKLYKKNERGWVMEIDRKKPNLEYSEENCVAACYWCNNAKTDEFDDIEFKPIGKLIGETLKARLKK